MKSEESWHAGRTAFVGYAVAALCVAADAIITDGMRSVWPATPNGLFFLAVILSAWLGGWGPGLLASVLSSVVIVFWMPPPLTAVPNLVNETPRFLMFVGTTAFISWTCSRQKEAQDALRRAHDELEQKVRDRTQELTRANEELKVEVAGRKKVESALRESETRLEAAQRIAHIGHWERDVATDMGMASDELFRIFGLEKKPAFHLSKLRQVIHPDDRALQQQALADALQGVRRYDVEYRVVRSNDDVRHVHSLGDVRRNEADRPVLMFGTVQDITDRKRTEALMDGQKRVLEMIATGAPLEESLTGLVRLIEAQVPGMLGSILLLDLRDGRLRHGAAPSLPADYVAAIDGTAIGPNVGSCGTAAYEKATVFVEDIAADSRWTNYRNLALPHGLRACWSTPIFNEQRQVLGTFAMYYHRPVHPEPEHLRLIDVVTHIAAIAITGSRTRAALQESEARLKEAQRIASIGYWDRDLVHDRITWSEETWRIFGLPVQDRTLCQAELQQMIYPDDRELQLQALARSLEDHQPYDVEYRIVQPGGEVRYVHIRDEIVCDPQGRTVRVFGTVQDTTDRKRAEALALSREQEIKDIVDNSPDHIVRFDRNLRRTYVNPAFSRANGVPSSALLGRELGSAVRDGAVAATTEETSSIETSLRQVLATSRPVDFETTWPMPGGRRNYAVHMEPEFDAEGRLQTVLVISRDVTELKEREGRLREAEAELARVARVTIVGELTASIAHEVNQPLTAVVANADAAARWLEAVPPDLAAVRESVRRISRDGVRASEVIQRMRTLMKKGGPARVPVNLNDLVRETVALAQPEISRRKAALQTDLAPDLPPVPADRVQLQQVLLNLVVNALDAMGAVENRPRVLRIGTDRPEPQAVQVAVADTGVGIAPQVAARLFEPFYTTKADGLGIGLAISRSIVEAHGGRLWETPNPGHGAIFQFTLPVEEGGAS